MKIENVVFTEERTCSYLRKLQSKNKFLLLSKYGITDFILFYLFINNVRDVLSSQSCLGKKRNFSVCSQLEYYY